MSVWASSDYFRRVRLSPAVIQTNSVFLTAPRYSFTEEGQISIINNGANAWDYSFEYYRAATVFAITWGIPEW